MTTVPFDPEGILGTINCVILAFLGLQVPLISYLSRQKGHFRLGTTVRGRVTVKRQK